jgi:V/A-type H+/Na+-transporting ATPase subunit D
MRATGRIAPTRMNLLRAKRRLGYVLRGTELLRRKREALVAEVFRLARPAADARKLIAERASAAYPPLLSALAVHGDLGVRSLGWPLREVEVEMTVGHVWGISVSQIGSRPPLRRTLDARGTAPGATGPAAAEAARQFEELVDLLLDAAPREMLIRRLGEALGRTSRQVSTLENRVSPELRADIAAVQGRLQEREREEQFRLKRLLKRRRFEAPSREEADRCDSAAPTREGSA